MLKVGKRLKTIQSKSTHTHGPLHCIIFLQVVWQFWLWRRLHEEWPNVKTEYSAEMCTKYHQVVNFYNDKNEERKAKNGHRK